MSCSNAVIHVVEPVLLPVADSSTMNQQSGKKRSEWFDASRALGDLLPEAVAEWNIFVPDCSPVACENELAVSLNALVASLEHVFTAKEPLPNKLELKMKAVSKACVKKSNNLINRAEKILWLRYRITGWTVAASTSSMTRPSDSI